MKARHELNMRLYSEKANGRENDVSDNKNNYIAIRLGDKEKVNAELENKELCLKNALRKLSENELRSGIYSFILEADRISREAVSVGMSTDEAETLSGIYICKADKCADTDCLEKLFEDMCLDFAERINEITADISISPHIRKCRAYIYGNLNADLSVKGLAKLTGLDPTYLSKLFSKEMGVPIKKFVTNAKIDTAKNLLRYTELKFIEIAYSLGFSSQSAFIRTFKKETGVTPKRFRNDNEDIEKI